MGHTPIDIIIQGHGHLLISYSQNITKFVGLACSPECIQAHTLVYTLKVRHAYIHVHVHTCTHNCTWNIGIISRYLY